MPTLPRPARFVPALVAFTLALALAGCPREPAPPTFEATDITGASFAHTLALPDHNGVPRTLGDFKGKVVAVFFGYTHCPDVCPTTLSDFAAALNLLGADADRVQVLFVTVDPERDTPAVLKQFVPAFDARFLGLSGDAETTRKVAQEFKVVYQKSAGETDPKNYLVDHNTGTYVFDRNGKVRLLISHGSAPEAIAADLKTLLAQG
jgi:protein SCO1/2